jgi:LysM domain
MRTRKVARWRKAGLGGALAVLLTTPLRAEQEAPPPPVPPQAMEPQAEQPKRKPSPQLMDVPLDDSPPPRRRKSAPITELSPRPPPDDNIKPVPGTPEEYTIQKGDTLWDLSQKFLSNPWYWPKIWSLNPSIENPHWIYPGNKLRIVPGEGGSQAPAQLQAETEAGIDATALNAPEEQEALPGASPETSVTMPDTADLEVVSRNSREGRAALSTVSVSGKLAFSPPPVLSVRTSGLVTPEEMRGAGTLEASFEEKQMLATYDTAYARFRGEVPARPGDKLLIFRPEGPIVDPITHRTLARQTKTVGVAKVLSLQGTQATVQIERTFEEVERGDFVRPWVAQEKRIAPRPNTADVVGKIVQSVNSSLTTYGESHEVFIDRGSEDGVEEGNTFAVVRWGDGLNAALVTRSFTAGKQGARAAMADVPEENVGLLLVIDTRDHLSTAVVIKSVRELKAGDMVEMRASGSGGDLR